MDCRFLRFTSFRSSMCLSFPLMRTAARARATLCCRRPNNAKCGASANVRDTGERENYGESTVRESSAVPTVEQKKETVRRETEGRKKAKNPHCQMRASRYYLYFVTFALSTLLAALCTLTYSPIFYRLFTKRVEPIRLFSRQSQSLPLSPSFTLSLSLFLSLSAARVALFTFARTFRVINQEDSDDVSTRPFRPPVSPFPLALSRASNFRQPDSSLRRTETALQNRNKERRSRAWRS